MCAQWGVARERVAVIRNGVSAHPPCSAAELDALRRELRVTLPAFVIGSVGRLARVKGYDRLLDAVAGMDAPEGTPWRLLLVGDGPERGALQDQARRLGIGERVIFAGYRPDARQCLELMDLFVLASRSEGVPLGLLEAMASGRPVRVTDAGDCRTVIDDGRAGFLWPPEEDEWPRTLAWHLTPEGAAQGVEKAARARQSVADRYSVEACLNAYEEIYRSLVKSPHTRRG
jgi:glycosyltransferase involved in cell wall biosynthesis